MKVKINRFGLDVVVGDYLYDCPRCSSEIHEHDILFVIEGKCYCLDCRRPSMEQAKSFNMIGAEKMPTIEQLAEKIRRVGLI